MLARCLRKVSDSIPDVDVFKLSWGLESMKLPKLFTVNAIGVDVEGGAVQSGGAARSSVFVWYSNGHGEAHTMMRE